MPSRSRRALVPAVLAVVAAAALLVGLPGTHSALTAVVTNPTNSVATGAFTCTAAAVGNAASFAYPLAEAVGVTAADVSGNNRPGTYSLLGVTYGVAGPCPRDSGRAVTLYGLLGYVSGPTAISTNPQVFSEEIWFRTTTAGGKLIGFGSARTGSSITYDRHVYLTNSGQLAFGVNPGSFKTVVSSASYTDGAWHDVIATLAPAGDANPGMRLYVDGALVASDPATTSAQVFNGYWRIGYDNLTNVGPTTPTNFFFTGSLAYASVYPTALTPAQVAAHRRAGV